MSEYGFWGELMKRLMDRRERGREGRMNRWWKDG